VHSAVVTHSVVVEVVVEVVALVLDEDVDGGDNVCRSLFGLFGGPEGLELCGLALVGTGIRGRSGAGTGAGLAARAGLGTGFRRNGHN
jgi:hypothetical protein